MKRGPGYLCASLLTFAIFAAPAAAQNAPVNRCGPRSEMVKQLASIYKEAPVATGISDTGSIFEVLAAKDGNTWTVLITRPNGVACVVMAGDSLQFVTTGTNL